MKKRVTMYDMVEPCSDSGAYVAEPNTEVKFDLERCEEELKELSYEIKFSSEVILLMEDKERDVEVAIYPSGKLLFKTIDKEVVEELYDEVMPVMEKLNSS